LFLLVDILNFVIFFDTETYEKAMTAQTSRRLIKMMVVGNVEGQFSTLFQRVEQVHKTHGPFDMVLCAGNFFGDQASYEDLASFFEFIKGTRSIPIPTYIVSDDFTQYPAVRDAVSSTGDFATHLTYLGACGLYITVHGVRLAYYMSKEAQEYSEEGKFSVSPEELEERRQSLMSMSRAEDFGGVDILITRYWPKGVTFDSNWVAAGDRVAPEGNLKVTELNVTLRPKYHFIAGRDIHFERVPFRQARFTPGTPIHVCRFIVLADVGNSQQLKWLYALNVSPIVVSSESTTMPPRSNSIVEEPAGTTNSPFEGLVDKSLLIREKRKWGPGGGTHVATGFPNVFFDMRYERGKRAKTGDKHGPPSTYRCHRCGQGGHWKPECPKNRLEGTATYRVPPQGYVCRICHESGHFIQQCPRRQDRSSAGNEGGTGERYVPSVMESCWFCLSNPEIDRHLIASVGTEAYLALAKGGLTENHLLLVPISHVSSMADLGDQALIEFQMYKRILRDFYRTTENLSLVFYETNFRSHHAHTQIFPLPSHIDSNQAKQAFFDHAASLRLDWAICSSTDQVS
jgi:hypothetical protein